MKIYVASSWRNMLQPEVVKTLRAMDHEVYDFKDPGPSQSAFSWKRVDPNWQSGNLVTPTQHKQMLQHPTAQAGFKSDMDALHRCDACVLVLPCGRSAHLELGWAAGQRKKTVVLEPEPIEPDLMYLMCDQLCTSFDDLIEYFDVR